MSAETASTGRQGRRRPGRWRSGEDSRRRILEAARTAFARSGYDRATIRQIADDAQVDSAMVHYFFKSKSGLFAEAMRLPDNPVEHISTMLAGGIDGLGERIIRRFLSVWDGAGNVELLALLRSAPTDDRMAELSREFVEREIISRFEGFIGSDSVSAAEARLRAELVGSHLMGVALARYLLRIEPMASADHDDIVKWVAPTLQRYLTADSAE